MFHKIDEPTSEYLALQRLGSLLLLLLLGLHQTVPKACQPRAQSVLVGGFKGFPKMAFVPPVPSGPSRGGVFPGAP